MAKIKITDGNNEVFEVNGRMTFKVSKAFNDVGDEIMVCLGQLTTHKYFEEITKIESDRFVLENVEVTDETFGTNDFNILYDFQVNDFGWSIKEDYLSQEAINAIEKDEYKNDEGDYYKMLNGGDK